MSTTIASSNITSAFIDLASYDELDKYSYGGEDSITYFVRETVKSTWFSQVPVALSRNSGSADFGQQWSVQLSRAGDYLLYTWLRATFPEITPAASDTKLVWTHNPMHSLIQEAAVQFNDLTAMRFDNYFLDFWAAFTIDEGKKNGYNNMIGAGISDFSLGAPVTDVSGAASTLKTAARTLNLPLPFFFARDSGVALPTAALPYNDMRIAFKFREWTELLVKVTSGSTVNAVEADVSSPQNLRLTDVNVWANYAIVSSAERKRMGCGGRDILIEQVQTFSPSPFAPSSSDTTLQYDIRFAHAVKALFFGVRNKSITNDHGNYSIGKPAATNAVIPATSDANPLKRASLIYESTTRMEMDVDYYSLVNPYYHAKSIPSENGYNMYSYALDVTNLDPQGSTNYGKLVNVSWRVQPAAATVTAISGGSAYEFFCVALNHNVVRVSGGALGFPVL